MKNESVTVRMFKNEIEACLLKHKLEQHGLHPTVHSYSRYKAMAGAGILVKVPPEEQGRALVLLAQLDKPIDMDEYVEPDDRSHARCPECGSVHITARSLSAAEKREAVLSLGLCLLFQRRDWNCQKCGYEWHD